MRICIFIKALTAGGAEKQSILLAHALKDDHEVIFIVFENRIDERFHSLLEPLKIPFYTLDGSLPSRIQKVYRLLKLHRTEALFSYLATDNLVGGLIGRLAGVKYIVGGIRNSRIDGWKMPVQRWLHRRVHSFTIFNNDSGRESLIQKGFRSNKSVVIENCFDREMVGGEYPEERSSKISILMVGRFVPQKDYDTALDTISFLKDELGNTNFIVTIIGHGELKGAIREKIASSNLEQWIKIVENPPEIYPYYRGADIYFTCSIFEGFSNTIMEAMSFSLPVVATDVGDNHKLVSNGENGYLLPAKDVSGLANALNSLCNMTDLRNSFGTKSIKLLRKNYSPEAFKEKYNEFIRSKLV